MNKPSNPHEWINNFLDDRKKFLEKYPKTWGEIKRPEENNLLIEIPSPELLSEFAGYLKYKANGRVFFRGENRYFRTTFPSLFRNMKSLSEFEIQRRYSAYKELITEFQLIFKNTRFMHDNGSLLQHYGMKTVCLDLVDNIFVALWFSNHNSKKTHSYIKFFHFPIKDKFMNVLDLRSQVSSLSLRPHCQHGFSAIKRIEKWNTSNIDYNSNLIAIAKVPNNQNMKLDGYIFSDDYMFPSKELDDTYRLLKSPKFNEIITKIINKYKLNNNDLGRISP